MLIGIGGSSLGTEAVHAVLDKGKVTLSVLDTVSVSKLHEVKTQLAGYKKVTDIVVCVISKSGNTTETLANAAVILDDLKAKFGEAIFDNLFIGGAGTDFHEAGQEDESAMY